MQRSHRRARPHFLGVSAAVLWGLPLYRVRPSHVHIASRTRDGRTHSSVDGVARHEFQIALDQLTERNGCLATTLARTVVDLARALPVESGLAAADAALRLVAWDEGVRQYDETAAETFREELWEIAERAAGGRGIRAARFVLAFADGRAQLPGESVSRLRFHQLGFAPPRLQVAVPAPRGADYTVDFGLDEIDRWGEFDGDGKYVLAGSDGSVDPTRSWKGEKEREDWIRATTGRGFIRWGWDHLALDAFRARLVAFRVPLPRLR